MNESVIRHEGAGKLEENVNEIVHNNIKYALRSFSLFALFCLCKRKRIVKK